MYDYDAWKNTYPHVQTSGGETIFWLSSARDIPHDFWSSDKDVLQNKDWLSAVEMMTSEDFEVGFLVIASGEDLVAHCMVQFVFVPFAKLQGYIPSWLSKVILRVPKFTFLRKSKKVIGAMVVGDLMITSSSPSPDPFQTLLEGVNWLDRLRSNNVELLHVFKDINPADSTNIRQLHDLGYRECFSEPEMILVLDERWKTIQDYVETLNKKYRQRFRSARKKRHGITARSLDIFEIESRMDELQVLLSNVLERRRFSLLDERVEFYLECAKNLKEKFDFRVYELEGEAVGFATSIRQGDALIAHRVGIDYECNSSHKLYQNILYDYIEEGITNRNRCLSLGRTAMEIKSAVGAEPQNLTIMMKYNFWLPNLFLRYVLHAIPKPQWVWRNAKKNNNELPAPLAKNTRCIHHWLWGCTDS